MTNAMPVRIVIVLASTREGRFGPTVGRWFAAQASARPDVVVDVLDLADARLPDTLTASPPPEVVSVSRRLAAADAFVIVTPEYNHSFPAPLKTLIDWHGAEWRAKPVGFVSYGGRSGGLRAVEQLRQIFAELHAVTIRDVVSFAMAGRGFGDDGMPRDAEEAAKAARVMVDQLTWWADATAEARRKRPYGAPRQAEAA